MNSRRHSHIYGYTYSQMKIREEQMKQAEKYPLGLDTSVYKSNREPEYTRDNPYIKRVDVSKYKKQEKRGIIRALKNILKP